MAPPINPGATGGQKHPSSGEDSSTPHTRSPKISDRRRSGIITTTGRPSLPTSSERSESLDDSRPSLPTPLEQQSDAEASSNRPGNNRRLLRKPTSGEEEHCPDTHSDSPPVFGSTISHSSRDRPADGTTSKPSDPSVGKDKSRFLALFKKSDAPAIPPSGSATKDSQETVYPNQDGSKKSTSGPSAVPNGHICRSCNERFSSASKLSAHTSKRVCGQRDKCQFCGMYFSSFASVRQHERRSHSKRG